MKQSSVYLSNEAKEVLKGIYLKRVLGTGVRVTYSALVTEALELLKRQEDRLNEAHNDEGWV